jgi:hypothetical protein
VTWINFNKCPSWYTTRVQKITKWIHACVFTIDYIMHTFKSEIIWILLMDIVLCASIDFQLRKMRPLPFLSFRWADSRFLFSTCADHAFSWRLFRSRVFLIKRVFVIWIKIKYEIWVKNKTHTFKTRSHIKVIFFNIYLNRLEWTKIT